MSKSQRIATAALLVALAHTAIAQDAREKEIRYLEETRAQCAAYPKTQSPWFAHLVDECLKFCAEKLKKRRAGDFGPGDPMCYASSRDAALYAAGTLFEPGKGYEKIVPAMATSAPPGHVEIIILSSLYCGHCLEAREKLFAWAKGKSNHSVRSVPLMWGYDQKRDVDYDAYALVDLFCDALGDDALSTRVRKHVTSLPYQKRLRSTDDVRPMLLAAGIDAEKLRALDSVSLKARMRQAQEIGMRVKVQEAPAYVVNGKYVVVRDGFGGGASKLDVVQFLIERDAGVIGAAK
jgi:protein dithiol oxidoreductase (disulfide-forming)